MAKDAIDTVLSSLITALEWDSNLLKLFSAEQASARSVLTTTEQTSTQAVSTATPQIDIDYILSELSLVPSYVRIENKKADAKKIEVKKNDPKIEIQEITFYGNDGNMEHPTVEGNCFFQGRTQYIGVKVWIKKVSCDMDAELHWRIFRENGTIFSKENILSTTLHASTDFVYHSWGWADPGHWKPGKYKVVAYFNGKSEKFTGWFTVYP